MPILTFYLNVRTKNVFIETKYIQVFNVLFLFFIPAGSNSSEPKEKPGDGASCRSQTCGASVAKVSSSLEQPADKSKGLRQRGVHCQK